MATDPSAIIQGMLQSAGLGRTVSDFQQQDAQTQGMNLRNQQAQLQMTAAQQEQQRTQAFQTALGGLSADPSDSNLAKIALQFPEQVDALKKSKALLDAPVLNSHKTYFSGLERVAAANNGKLVTQQLQAMISAEKAQGHDTSEAEDMLSRVNAGDPAAMKQVQAFAKGQLYVIDPDYAAAIDKAHAGENANHYTSTSDGMVYDQRTGATVREAPTKYQSVRDGEKLIPLGRDGAISEGGGQASGGGSAAPSGAPAGRTTGGWTPRERNGGDNPDSAVDNKIVGAAQYLGVGPTDDITKISPRKIAEAMTLSEGGKGSLADRNNNPGNLRNGDGSYKKFPTKEAGLNAAAALVARKLRNGQTNVQTLIEGLPARGGGSASATRTGDPAGTIYGNPKVKEQFRILDPSEVPAGLDPNVRYQVSPNGQITPLGGQKQGNLKPWPAPALAQRVANDAALVNINGALKLLSPKNLSPEAKAAQGAVGFGTGLLGNRITNWNDPKGADFRARIGQISGIQIKDTSGAAVSLSEDERLAKWIPKIDDAPGTIRAKLGNLRREIQQRNQAMEDTYTEDQGFRPLHAQNVPAGPPPGAIQMLMNNPKLRGAFDAKYGKGASARVLSR